MVSGAEPETYHAGLTYAACLICGWCGPMRRSSLVAGADDDAHLAAKLAAILSNTTQPPAGTGGC